MKIKTRIVNDRRRHEFFCPGCGGVHWFTDRTHEYNGDPMRPVVRPSLNYVGRVRCHSIIHAGMITFMDDSTHENACKTLVLPDVYEEGVNYFPGCTLNVQCKYNCLTRCLETGAEFVVGIKPIKENGKKKIANGV